MEGKKEIISLRILLLLIVYAASAASYASAAGDPNYREALSKSLLFLQGQRSGKLPPDQKVTWRSDSGLGDGSSENVDLSGGYYDAGDNIKFNLPMAFTTTLLSWSVIAFGDKMGKELEPAREAIRWGTDYLLQSTSKLPDALYIQVGDPVADHLCWVRPEDPLGGPGTSRPVFKATRSSPATEVAAETAAALAAASVVFAKSGDKPYAEKLLKSAVASFEFGNRFRGNYSDHVTDVVCPFYCSYSGYQDELLWGAAWLYRATANVTYLNYALSLGIDSDSYEFSWDTKLPGARILLTREFLVKHNDKAAPFHDQAQKYICGILPGSSTLQVTYTPGGLLHKKVASNLQHVTTASLLLVVYAMYMKAPTANPATAGGFRCGEMEVSPALLTHLAKRQVDYILASNPKGMSYMVGYGNQFPQRIHHRASTIPGTGVHSAAIACNEGFQFYNSPQPNPNVLTGAIVGGPDENDEYEDARDNFAQSEPPTYIAAPLVGTLACLVDKYQSE